MKHNDRFNDDELHYLDTINRMTRQLHFRDKLPMENQPGRLQLTVEELEDQLETIRLSQEKQHHRR